MIDPTNTVMSRKVKTKGKPPTLRQLVLSQTGKHDHLLEKPEDIRKYFKLSYEPIKFVGDAHFIDDGAMFNYEDMERCRMEGYRAYNAITDYGSVDTFLYRTYNLGPVFGPSCTESVYWYVGIESTAIRCFSIKVKHCEDVVGFTEYEKFEQVPFPGTLESLLTEYPYLITRLDLENDLDNILAELQ